MKYPKLFSPVEIRGKLYRNRLIAAPTLFAHSVLFFPEASEQIYSMVEKRAKGGFAAVSTGELPVNTEEGNVLFCERKIDYSKLYDSDFEKIKEYATRIKKHGALAYLEICHEGADAPVKLPYYPVGPDEYVREDGIKVHSLDIQTMKKICDDYTRIAKYAKACGFDGVLVHGGHGFNMQQFVSPRTNHRTDDFGGSIENRTRFPKMILEAVRKGIGENMILELRFSAEDGVEGGMTVDDTVEFCKQIDGMVDIIQISNGIKELGNKTQTFSDLFDIHGVNVKFAGKVKRAVKKSRVAVIGGVNSPELCEKILEEGNADFIELGRQGFADPEFPNKSKSEKEDYIRKCVRCFQCYPGFCEHETDCSLEERGYSNEQVAHVYSPLSMGMCAINPDTGFRQDLHLKRDVIKKRVLIIGGGVAGMQAAITATERGHDVTLIEKSNKLGGIINFTDKDNDKVDLCNFKNLLIRETNESKAEVLLKTELDENLLKKINPDHIIVAVGSKPKVPNIPGIENAISGLDVYEKNPATFGKRIVMAGGGLVGCEVGLHLAEQGHKVTIIDGHKMMAYELFGYYRNALMDEMDKRGIKQILNARCLAFELDNVIIQQDGENKIIPADTTVFSMGMESNTASVEFIQNIAGDIPVNVIGDCRKIGKIGNAVREGFVAAIAIG